MLLVYFCNLLARRGAFLSTCHTIERETPHVDQGPALSTLHSRLPVFLHKEHGNGRVLKSWTSIVTSGFEEQDMYREICLSNLKLETLLNIDYCRRAQLVWCHIDLVHTLRIWPMTVRHIKQSNNCQHCQELAALTVFLKWYFVGLPVQHFVFAMSSWKAIASWSSVSGKHSRKLKPLNLLPLYTLTSNLYHMITCCNT